MGGEEEYAAPSVEYRGNEGGVKDEANEVKAEGARSKRKRANEPAGYTAAGDPDSNGAMAAQAGEVAPAAGLCRDASSLSAGARFVRVSARHPDLLAHVGPLDLQKRGRSQATEAGIPLSKMRFRSSRGWSATHSMHSGWHIRG